MFVSFVVTHIAELQAKSNEVIGERMGGKSKKKISYLFDSDEDEDEPLMDEVDFYEAGFLHKNDDSGRGLAREASPVYYGAPEDSYSYSDYSYSSYYSDYSDYSDEEDAEVQRPKMVTKEIDLGSDEEEKTWNAVIRQALIAGYLAKDIENYGLLKITEKGKEFIKKPVSFKITEDNEFDEEEEEVPVRGGAACAVDPALFSMMKDLRKKLSKRLEVPPFVIFQDPSLEAMATTYPVTLEELQNIPGVGAGKAKRYGKEFIELIKRHVEENEIERPEDLRVRTVANKSKLKVSIIQRIDRKVALDEIAMTNGLEFNELLDEIEAIVYSGTRINIDYFLNDVMDEDHIDDIYEYFKDSETDDLEDAIEELGGDYTEEEIRLVRIKFLSEMAN